MEHPTIDNEDPPEKDPDISSSVTVDVRHFEKFLHSGFIKPENVICCISENFALILHVMKGNLIVND